MADITQRGQLTRDDSNFPLGWNYKYLNSTGTSVIKTTPGILHGMTFNRILPGSVVALYDVATASLTGTFAVITASGTSANLTLSYDLTFNNGLYVSVTTTASDITISYI